MGVWNGESSFELAPADVAVTHVGRQLIWRAGVWAPPYRCIAAGGGRCVAVFIVCDGHRRGDEKRGRGRPFRGAPAECRSGGMGGGAEDGSVHDVFPECLLRVCLVREKAGRGKICAGGGAVCAGANVEGDGSDASFGTALAGLLAIAKDGRRWVRWRDVQLEVGFEAWRGESATAADVRRHVSYDALYSPSGTCACSGIAVELENKEWDLFLFDVFGEVFLAGAAGSVLSAPGEFAKLAGCWNRGNRNARDFRRRLEISRTALRCRRLALVSSDPVSDGRVCAVGKAGDGRPVHVHPDDWSDCRAGVADRGVGEGEKVEPERFIAAVVAGDCAVRVFDGNADRILARQLHAFRANSCGDEPERHGRKQFWKRVVRARRRGRCSATFSGGGRVRAGPACGALQPGNDPAARKPASRCRTRVQNCVATGD